MLDIPPQEQYSGQKTDNKVKAARAIIHNGKK